jgi:hypothetical protein
MPKNIVIGAVDFGQNPALWEIWWRENKDRIVPYYKESRR